MTLNECITAFSDYVSANDTLLKEFHYCEPWEIEGNLKPGTLYPLLIVNCESTTVTDNTILRSFRFMVMDIVSKDKSNENDVLSDTEFALTWLINDIKCDRPNNPAGFDEMTVIGDPVIEQFKEEFGDWCAGWSGVVTIETNNINNPCFE